MIMITGGLGFIGSHTTQASDDAERQFLAPLTGPAIQQLKDALYTLVTQPGR